MPKVTPIQPASPPPAPPAVDDDPWADAPSSGDPSADPLAVEPAADAAPLQQPAAVEVVRAQNQAAQAGPLQQELGSLTEETDWLSIGWYGREVTAKTTDLCDMAKLGPMVLINAESGAKPSVLRDRHGVPIENVLIWPNPAKGESLTYDGLENLYFRLKAELQAKPGCWVGVGFDSLSEIVRLLIQDERTSQYIRQQRTGRGNRSSRFFVDRDDYRTVTTQVGELLRKLRGLPCHFAFTALERFDDQTKLFGPSANPGVANDLPGFVDFLLHTQQIPMDDGGPNAFVGWSQPHGANGEFRAKDRYSILPRSMANPTFTRVLAYVRTGLTADTDDQQQDLDRRRLQIAQAAAQETERATS